MTAIEQIEQTIEHLAQQVALRQDAIRALQMLLPAGALNGAVETPPPPTQAPATKTERRGNRTKHPASGPAPDGRGSKILAAAAQCREPFTYVDVARQMGDGATPESILNALSYAGKTGKLKEIQKGVPGKPGLYGLPKTSRSVPAAAPAPARVPGLDEPQVQSLEEQLKQACKERDSAVANGRETLAKILQDKVNGLQRRYDAALATAR